jgi:hypothetical protein
MSWLDAAQSTVPGWPAWILGQRNASELICDPFNLVGRLLALGVGVLVAAFRFRLVILLEAWYPRFRYGAYRLIALSRRIWTLGGGSYRC